MKAALARIGQTLRAAFDLNDAFWISGLAAACYGVAQIHEPAAWIVAGAALFWLGVRDR